MIDLKQNAKPAAEAPAFGLKPADIYYAIFRHKWVILGFLLLGGIGATIVFFAQQALYWSEAKLIVRYVVETKSMEAGGGTQVKNLDYGGEAIINSELEILTSLDLCEEVAAIIGPEKIAGPGKGSNTMAAAIAVYKGLTVENPRRSNIIRVRFTHVDPAICQGVLRQLIDSYFKRHVAIHRDSGAYDEIFASEKNKLLVRIRDYEKKLHDLKSQAGVISVEDAKQNLSQQLSRLRGDLFETEAKLAEVRALLGASASAATASEKDKNKDADAVGAPPEKVTEYKLICARLDAARANEFDMLAQYTDENPLVKRVRERIVENESKKAALEKEYPKLSVLYVPRALELPREGGPNPLLVTALETKISVLTNQISLVRNDITLLDNLETSIADVQRNLEIDQKNYVSVATTLAAAGFSEAMGTGKMSNIQPIQAPSPPVLNVSTRLKVVLGTFFGCLVLGLALAFLLEFLIDHTVRKASDFEVKFRMPLFLSIPRLGLNGHAKMLPLPVSSAEASAQQDQELKQTWASDHPLRPYIDGLRDQTLVHFEGDPHKPKLIGVTGCAGGSGVTSLAAGLAGALSETGDGNVLLLNLNFESQSVHPFYRGELTCDLADALETEKRRKSPVLQNLYVATAGGAADAESQNLSKQLARVVPKLRVSDYDYIVFDLPPTTPTTMTARLAGMMDLVILVVESEKDTHESVKEVGKLLSRSKARVSAVLNKVRNPVPRWLHKGV